MKGESYEVTSKHAKALNIMGFGGDSWIVKMQFL